MLHRQATERVYNRLTMSPHRRPAVLMRLLLLWLLVALLPLRGWAAGAMLAEMPMGGAVLTLSAEADGDDIACPHHAGHAEHAHSDAYPACALCDLCHAGSAPAQLATFDAALPASTHVLSARIATGRAQLSPPPLERPPRD